MNVKNLKKGFTLTELIIVIVIVGILAGVLIPTFINVVNKANRASDLSLVRNLNEALTLDSVENGKHETMYDALQAAEASGFDVAKISKKAKSNEILWDSENDVFCYLNGTNIEYYPNSVSEDKKIKDQIDYYKLWKIYSNVDEIPTTSNQDYSIYLAGNNTGDEKINATINLDGVGFDIGENEFDDSATVYYVDNRTNGRTVVIRTNWGNLTIDAPHGTVKHYNELNKLNVTQIAPDSFHAFGFIAVIFAFESGRFVAESSATFGQDSSVIADVLLASGNSDAISGLADTAFNQDAWDQNGVSKNHEGRVNQNHVHDYNDVVTNPTCTTGGYTTHTCKTCGHSYNDNEVDALGHDLGDYIVTLEAACETSGYKHKECSRCDYATEDEVIPELGHTYENAVEYVWNDDNSKCTARRMCSRLCGHIDSEEGTITSISQQQSCENDEQTTYTATFNNTAFETQINVVKTADALGHDLGDYIVTVEAACGTSGLKHRECSRCDYATENEVIPALVHELQFHSIYWTVEYTKAEAKYTCSRTNCNHYETYDDVTVSSEVTTVASCVNKEITTYTASYKKDNESITHTISKNVETANANGEHTYGSLVPASAPQKGTNGNKAYYQCSGCDNYFDENKQETTLAKLTTIYADYNLTLNGAIEKLSSDFVEGDFITIVFDYLDEAPTDSLTEIIEDKGDDFPNGISIYVSSDGKTIYFLSNNSIYLAKATGTEGELFFGSVFEFVYMTLVFNNLYIDNNSKIDHLFSGCIDYYSTDFESFFDGINVPDSKLDKIKFFYNMLGDAFLDNSCTLPNGITVDEIIEMPYYIDQFHIRFNRYHIYEKDATNDSQTIPNLDFAYELPNFRKQFINFIQGDSNDILDSAQKTILIFECGSNSDNPIGKNDFEGYFVKLTFTVYDETKFGDHGRFVIDDVEFINIKDDYYTLSNNEDPTLAKTTTAYIACDNQCDYIFNIGGNAQVFKVDGIVDNKYHKTMLVNNNDYTIPNGPRVFNELSNVQAYIGNPSFVVGSVVDSNGTNHDYIVKEYTNSNNITYKVTFSKKTNDHDWIYSCYLVEIVVQEE